MTPERWADIVALFETLVELPADRQETILAETAVRDPALAAEVRSLLRHHAHSGSFLTAPAWVADPTLLDDAPSLVGRTFGPYHIRAELGRGGMGIVYEADDTRLRRTVALKALPPEFTDDPDRRARLTREARAAAVLSHPCIATVYALEEIEGHLVIASELVTGPTLRDELRHGPLPAALLTRTLIDVASALEAAHALGIVHRDLKPENVMRRPDGQIKVLDFGLAREAPSRVDRRLTADTLPTGTPGYAAPEQWSGAANDPRIDIFAFGVLAWELGSGEHPFGSDPAAIPARMAAFLTGQPTTSRRPPPAIEAMALRCMRGDPAERYQTVSAVLAELRGDPVPVVGAAAARWWWQFHQASAAAVDTAIAAMAIATGGAHASSGGRAIWIAALVLATAAVTLRLHLLFVSRIHPALLAGRRSQIFRWIAAAEVLLAVLVAWAVAVRAAPGHDVTAAVLLTLAVALAAALLVIEPVTTALAGITGREGG